MVNVDIDKSLYESIKKKVKKDRYAYPSIKYFVQRAVYNEMLNSKDGSDNAFGKFYSKLKEILPDDPELISKVDAVYASEIKKNKKGVVR